MKKTFLLPFLLLVSTLLSAQGKEENQQIVIGKIDSLQSKILGEQRKIWVHVPEGVNQKFPVLYLLDGEGHFSSVVGMIQQLSSVNGNTVCPKMIVVGITNTDRTRDLTPTHIEADPPFMDSSFAKTSGGGENFISFIKKELMPHVEAKYPAAPYKMIVGHSFGGLTVMQTLVYHPQLFNSYVAIDPSMWWDNGKLLKQAQKTLAQKKFTGKSFYLAVANTMDGGMDIKRVKKDTSLATKHIRHALLLQDAFEKNKQNGLRYKGRYYPEDTHGSAPLIAEYDAIRFFFDFFPLRLGMKDLTDSTGALVQKYKDHYANLSKKMGYLIKPDETEINFIGYDFLGRKLWKTAEGFFKLNLQNYPGSYNVYDSYADYLIATGDKQNAILQLKRALAIQENPVSRKKLTDLEKENQ